MSDKSDSTTGKSGPSGAKSPEAPRPAPSGENESAPNAGSGASSPGSGGQTTRPKRRLKITRAPKRRDPPATLAESSPSGPEPEDQGAQPPVEEAQEAGADAFSNDAVDVQAAQAEPTAQEADAGDQPEDSAEAELEAAEAVARQVEAESLKDHSQVDTEAAGADSHFSVADQDPAEGREPGADDEDGGLGRGEWPADQEPDEQDDQISRGIAPESVAAPADWGPDHRDAPATAQVSWIVPIDAPAGPDEDPADQGPQEEGRQEEDRREPEIPAQTDHAAKPNAREAARARSFAPLAAAAGKGPGKSRGFLLVLILLLVLCLALLALFAWLRPILMAPETENPASKELTVEELTEIESLLGELLIEPGPIDGVVDDQTREAIRFYQESGGLPVDGEPTAALLNDLREVAGGLGGN